MKVPFRDLVKRVSITGVSVPLGGVQWAVDRSEQEKARRLIVYLEDRRVLYNDYDFEVPGECVHSVMEMRAKLVEALQDAQPNSDLANCLRFMVAACRKFLDEVERPRSRAFRRRHAPPWQHDEDIDRPLGALRGVFGVYLSLLAIAYRINIGGDLASILPGLPEDDR